MNQLIEEIQRLKKEKNAVILAHYYVNEEVQSIADYIGDSYYLSKLATKIEAKTIVFCGVSFMGESAKILNPEKLVLMPDLDADCPMAHMADKNKIEALRKEYPDLAVVCYINSTAELKMYSDVCVTSANALKIVKALPNKTIYFIPDEHLGKFIASQVPEKNFIFHSGFCHVHTSITEEEVKKLKSIYPTAEILVHPECTDAIVSIADYVGSTSGIIDYASKSPALEFIICTELGVLYELQQKNPNKKFYFAEPIPVCSDMKKITLEKVKNALLTEETKIEISDRVREKALEPLNRMLELAK